MNLELAKWNFDEVLSKNWTLIQWFWIHCLFWTLYQQFFVEEFCQILTIIVDVIVKFSSTFLFFVFLAREARAFKLVFFLSRLVRISQNFRIFLSFLQSSLIICFKSTVSLLFSFLSIFFSHFWTFSWPFNPTFTPFFLSKGFLTTYS